MIDGKKVRNKYENLRKEWVRWESLNNKTGAGWNSERQTVSGSDEWWDDRVKEFGISIKKYKRAPLEHLELQQQLFQGTHATGSYAYTPSSSAAFVQEEHSQQFTPSETENVANPWNFDGFQSELNETEDQWRGIPNLNSPSNPSLYQQLPTHTQQLPTQTPMQQTPIQQKSRNIGTSSNRQGGGKKRRGEMEDKVADIIDCIHERQQKKSGTSSESPGTDSTNTNSVRSTGNSLTYGDMIARTKRLCEMGDFTFGEALCVVNQPNNTELFNALEDDDAISWLSHIINRERAAEKYKYYKINKGSGSGSK